MFKNWLWFSSQNQEESSYHRLSKLLATPGTEDGFGQICRQVAAELGVPFVLIGEIQHNSTIMTKAFWHRDHLEPSRSISAADLKWDFCNATQRCEIHDPEALKTPFFMNRNIKGYFACPLQNPEGLWIGILAVFHDKPLHLDAAQTSLLTLLGNYLTPWIELAQIKRHYARQNHNYYDSMSHEIRSPLSSVKGFAEVLLTMFKKQEMKEQCEHYLQILLSNISNLEEAIYNISALAKFNPDSTEPKWEKFDLRVMVKGLMTLLKKTAMEQNIDFSYAFQGQTPVHISSDRGRLNHLLKGLLEICLEGPPSFSVVRLEVEPHPDQILFALVLSINEDDMQQREQQFQMLTQPLDKQVQGAFQDARLKRIAQWGSELQGKFTLEHTATHLTLNFWLNIDKIAITPERIIKSEKQVYAGKTVLIADDNDTHLFLTKIMLGDLGVQVETAINGKEALKKAEQCHPSLILMDLQMPEMDGIQTTEQLKQRPNCANIPVIGILPYGTSDTEKKSGCFEDCLSKPLQKDSLLALCKKYLGRENDPESPSEHTTSATMTMQDIPDAMRQTFIQEAEELANISFWRYTVLEKQLETMKQQLNSVPYINQQITLLQEALVNMDQESFQTILDQLLQTLRSM
ncbi:MAG: response regulator [SAR324 cluster bacterium]|nr:response regulator [SAR324 cluster bacterium]